MRATAWAVLLVCLACGVASTVLDVVTQAAGRAATGNRVGWMVGLPGVLIAVPTWTLLRRATRSPGDGRQPRPANDVR